MKSKLKMSGFYAYVERNMHLIVLSDEKKGYECTQEAYEKLEFQKGISLELYSVEIENKIIWVTVKEFDENNLVERPLKQSEFEG